jgi:CRP/FNR family transcriptional regulator, cyclic AMP receptor protein
VVAKSKKSGIRSFKPGDILFHENDVAQSLFIIQKGQIRLYRPKGRGYVDLAILRTGEVIGEMAYFDEKSRRRSCSAAAIVTTEAIEISFAAFQKTMAGLNPWFKTIINTLADRLRKTNEKVKQLETNSVGFGAGGKVADYVFFHTADVMKILTTLYLVYKTNGEQDEDGFWRIHMSKLKFYMFDIYNVMEVKWEEFFEMLKNAHFADLVSDADGLPKILRVQNPDEFRQMVVFFNSQKLLEDNKKIMISSKCERFLSRIIEQLDSKKIDKPQGVADITIILEDFRTRNVPISDEDFKDAVNANLAQDIIVGEGNKLTAVVEYQKLKKIFPALRMSNAIKKVNEIKVKDGKGGY